MLTKQVYIYKLFKKLSKSYVIDRSHSVGSNKCSIFLVIDKKVFKPISVCVIK